MKLYIIPLTLALVSCGSETTDTPEPQDVVFPSPPTNVLIVEGEPFSFDITYENVTNLSVQAPPLYDIEITPTATSARVDIFLNYDAKPIGRGLADFVLNGTTITGQPFTRPFTFEVVPTSKPDVYILAGQSNMVGFPEEPIEEVDITNDRILQLNVHSDNDVTDWLTEEDYLSINNNTHLPLIVKAEEPLHSQNKDKPHVGMGMTFAVEALQNTTANIVLVPTAYSASRFCDRPGGPVGQWNVTDGNTWMFDRAILRANLAMEETNGILRGVLWHQGESDSYPECAPFYEQNLVELIEGFRERIILNGAVTHDDVPFILGTMSRGEEYADYDQWKTIVDNVHRNIPTIVPNNTGVVLLDDIVPSNGFPCGVRGDCIHYGATALREMGRRYYEMLFSIMY